MKKKTIDDITNQKPDLETESLRIWNAKKGEVEDKDEENDFEVEYKGMKLKLTGFNIGKKDGEIVFAYKVKRSDTGQRYVLYYATEKGKEIEKDIKETFGNFIVFQNVRDTFESIYQEMQIREKKK